MKAYIPECLSPYADMPAWVAWNAEARSGEMRKIPKCPRTGASASVSDPRTWGTLAAARRLAEVRAYPGVGIVSAAVPDLVFLDLDRCIDPGTGDSTRTCGQTGNGGSLAASVPHGGGLAVP